MRAAPYKKRSLKELEATLRKAMGLLHLRDWSIDLHVGSAGGPIQNCGLAVYDPDTMEADIWVYTEACEADDRDPMHVLYHEIAHIWINDSRNEEARCNVLASLLMT